MIDKSITSLSDVEINALGQIMNESNFYNSITVAESPFSSIAVFDDNDVMQVKPFAEVDITYGEENVNVVLSRSSQEKCWFIKIFSIIYYLCCGWLYFYLFILPCHSDFCYSLIICHSISETTYYLVRLRRKYCDDAH